MLRTGEGKEAINVLFDYGYTGGHAHPDKLNIALYANGQVQAPDGILLYTVPEAFTYNGQPVGHNTVVVDELAQHPSDAQSLTFLGVTGCVQIADAVDSEAYTGVHLRRTVILTESYLVDFFRAAGDRPHRYDWVYHNLGGMSTELSLHPHRGSLGMANGYNHVVDVSKAKTDGPWRVTCTADEQRPEEAVLVQMPGGEPTEVIIGSGPGVFRSRPEEPMPVLLARRFCDATVYATTLEPYHGQPRIREVSRIEASHNGMAVDPTEATGLQVERDSGKDFFLMGYNGRQNSFGDIESDGEILAVSIDGEGAPQYLYAVKATAAKVGEFTVGMASPATVYLEQRESGGYVLENQGEASVEVSLGGLLLENPGVYTLDASLKKEKETPSTIEANRLIFTANPKTWYEITGR